MAPHLEPNFREFCWIGCHQLLPWAENLRRILDINAEIMPCLWGLGECQRLGICTNRKPIHDFPLPLNTELCSIRRRLAVIPMSCFDPQIRPPFGGLGWTQEVDNGTNRHLVPTFLFDLYTHYRPVLHRVATLHNAADRQTDRSLAIGRLCYSIDGLKTTVNALVSSALIHQPSMSTLVSSCVITMFYVNFS